MLEMRFGLTSRLTKLLISECVFLWSFAAVCSSAEPLISLVKPAVSASGGAEGREPAAGAQPPSSGMHAAAGALSASRPAEAQQQPRVSAPLSSLSLSLVRVRALADRVLFRRVFRCTLTSIPQTQSLLNKAKLPLGLLLHPFKDLSVSPLMPRHHMFHDTCA